LAYFGGTEWSGARVGGERIAEIEGSDCRLASDGWKGCCWWWWWWCK
jgi:hypothetical protein